MQTKTQSLIFMSIKKIEKKKVFGINNSNEISDLIFITTGVNYILGCTSSTCPHKFISMARYFSEFKIFFNMSPSITDKNQF